MLIHHVLYIRILFVIFPSSGDPGFVRYSNKKHLRSTRNIRKRNKEISYMLSTKNVQPKWLSLWHQRICYKPRNVITLNPFMFLCPRDLCKGVSRSLAGIIPSVVAIYFYMFCPQGSYPGNHKVSTKYVLFHSNNNIEYIGQAMIHFRD